ncbi:class I SAM-dependent methyltransferase [Jatrophihabitans sp. DSM 45814]
MRKRFTSSTSDDGVVLGDASLQTQVLEDLSDAVNYRAWQADLALPHLGDNALEIGSGSGDFAATVAEKGTRITASEAEHGRLSGLRARFANEPLVGVRELVVPITETADYSAVVAFNVLEHIPDDVEALRAFGGLLEPGGRVVIFVPAFEVAMSRFDRAIGHQRRYTRQSLTEAMTAAGLEVRTAHYVNAIGLPSWIVGMRLLGMAPKSGALLTVWDRWVIPAMRRVEAWRRPPFGQSVFAVAVKRP